MDSLSLPAELFPRPSSRNSNHRLDDDETTSMMPTSTANDDPVVFPGSAPTEYGITSSHRSPGIGRPPIHLDGASEVAPGSGKRSASTPVFARRRQTQREDQAGTSSSASRHMPEHQWTVFGQLMEDEGQLPPSNSDPSVRSRTSFLRSGARNRSPSTVPAESSSLFQYSNVQSLEPERRTSFEAWTPGENGHVETDYNSDNSDDDDDSDLEDSPTPASDDEEESRGYRIWRRFSSLVPPLSIAYRNMLKCAIAYFIASLFTFEPHLSTLFSGLVSYGNTGEKRLPLPSGHMVATIAVYFNPAKTMGAMIEADLFVLMGLIYSAVVCMGSMAMYWWLELKPGWEWLADAIVLAWIGISMSVIAFFKVWMNNPSFNTACSTMAIIIFVVVVKEGGLSTLFQVTAIVLCGSMISNLVCYFIWPQSATSNLQANMIKTLDSFSTVLSMLTKNFLLETDTRDANKLQQAVQNHQNSFTSLKKDLGEAQSEWMYRDFNLESEFGVGSKGNSILKNEFASHRGYEDAVDSMNRLAQHLNGLRSGLSLQQEFTKAGLSQQRDPLGKARAIDDNSSAILDAAAEMFGDLVDDLGPPLKGLSGACGRTFKKLKIAFLKAKQRHPRARDILQPQDFIEMAEAIEAALVRFESTSNHALLRIYRKGANASSRTASPISGMRAGSSQWELDDDNNNLLTDEGEHVFLVYFFIFTLQEFAEELISLVDAMERIYGYERRRILQRSFWGRLSSSVSRRIALVRLWFKSDPGDSPPRTAGLSRSLSFMIPQHRVVHPFFPKVQPHAPDTVQTPSRDSLSFWGKIKYSIWEIGKMLKERNVKFAMRAGLAIALLAAPAFFDGTRQFFVENQGDWALVSTFIVMSPTIGATNMLSLQRVLGTLVGAVLAAAVFTIFPENAVLLSIFGFLLSLPCFYVAVTRPKHLSAARFILLTYNLTCLYRYNLRDYEDDIGVWEIAIDRALAVTVGVLWALIASRIWWPSEARKELTQALGEFCLNIGWLYTRLVASNSFAPEYNGERPEQQDEARQEGSSLVRRSIQITRLRNSIHEFMAMELHLQIKLIELQNLLAQAQLEPRLKGPFPVKLYRDILTSLQTILDRLHSMRCVTTREEWYTSVRKDFIMPVNKERHEMVGNVILGFSILASAFRLKAPLPPYLPPAEKSRLKLISAIRQLEVVKNREVKGSRQLLFFAYAIAMKGVTEGVEKLGRMLQSAFGVIGDSSESFDALFDQGQERDRIIEYTLEPRLRFHGHSGRLGKYQDTIIER